MRPRPLGLMPKDSLKMVANWLVKLFRSTRGSAMAQGGSISTGCSLKGNCVGVSKLECWLSAGRRC
jgi:hypothetical protein